MGRSYGKVAAFTSSTAMPAILNLLVLDERLRRFRLYTAFAIFAAILALGSIPGARQEIGLLATGVVLHSVAYATLSILLFTGLAGSRRRRAVTAFLAVAAMGALDESVQSLLPYRVGSVQDFAVDTIAALVTLTCLCRFLPQPAPVRSA